jgi:hypothetical protein
MTVLISNDVSRLWGIKAALPYRCGGGAFERGGTGANILDAGGGCITVGLIGIKDAVGIFV